MKLSLIVIFLLILTSCTTSVPIAKYSYFLDAPGGSFSEWNYESIPKNSKVDIKARFTINRSVEEWNSHASFKVLDNLGGSAVGLGITFSERDLYNLYLFSSIKNPKSFDIIRSKPLYFSSNIYFDKDFEISIQWKSQDELRVVLNSKEEQVIKLPFVPAIFGLTSSSGEINVSEMIINEM